MRLVTESWSLSESSKPHRYRPPAKSFDILFHRSKDPMVALLPSVWYTDGIMELAMATLSELAQVIAAVERIDPATVALIGRHLREAGLVTKHGRGPSAAHMGLADGANLLIGVNATRNAAHSAGAVKAYRRFRPDQYQIQISEMSRDFTLGEAIEQLLVAAGTSEPPTPFLGTTDYYQLSEAFETGEVDVELRFRTDAPSVLLRIAPELSLASGFEATPELRATIPALVSVHFSPRKARDPPNARQDQGGDRREETTIGFRTLREVGRLIRSRAS
jgi:hypothetical protein